MWVCEDCGKLNEHEGDVCDDCGKPRPTEHACVLCGTPYPIDANECPLCGLPISGASEVASEVESSTFATVASSFSEELSILDSIIQGKPVDLIPRKHVESPWLVDGTEPPVEPDDAYHIFAWVQSKRKVAKSMSEMGKHLMAAIVLQYIMSRMKQRYDDLIAAEPEMTASIFGKIKQSWFMARIKNNELKIEELLEKMDVIPTEEKYTEDLDVGMIALESIKDKIDKLIEELEQIITAGELEESRVTTIKQKVEERYRSAQETLRRVNEDDKELLSIFQDLKEKILDKEGQAGPHRVTILKDAITFLERMVSKGDPDELLEEIQELLSSAKEELDKLEEARRIFEESDLDIV